MLLDKLSIRAITIVCLNALRLFIAFIALKAFGEDQFEEVFSLVSLLSFLPVLSLGFVTGSKVVALTSLKSQNSNISIFIASYNLLILVVIILVIFLNLLIQSDALFFASMIYCMRFVAQIEEIKLELKRYKYAIRVALIYEVLILISIIQEKLIIPFVVICCLYIILSLVRVKEVSNFDEIKKFLMGSVSLRAFKLESSSYLLFALDVYWASVFLDSSEFIVYYFLARAYSGISVFYGNLTKNIWAQGYLASSGDAESYLKRAKNISIFLVLSIIAFSLALFLFQDWLGAFIQTAQDLNNNYTMITVLCFSVYSVLQLYNRVQKNIFSARNQLLRLGNPYFVIGLIYLFSLLVAYQLFQGPLTFWTTKLMVFVLITWLQSAILKRSEK